VRSSASGYDPHPTGASLISSRSQKQGLQSTQDVLRAQFYEKYRKEAEEYDKEFMKKHDEDLNTTLIFVSRARHSVPRILNRVAGRSVLRRNICIHHRGRLRTQVRPQRRDE